MIGSHFPKFAGAIALMLLISCVEKHQDWNFIQGVGGIALGSPYKTERGVFLPVIVDITGLKSITRKPTLINSGLALKKIESRRDKNTIYIALITTLVSKTYNQATSPDLRLGSIQPGQYSVVYSEPNGSCINIGTIDVAP